MMQIYKSNAEDGIVSGTFYILHAMEMDNSTVKTSFTILINHLSFK